MIIYLDTCCYGRPFDEARYLQERVETEAGIIGDVVELCKALGFPIMTSITVQNEINMIPDDEKREDVRRFYEYAISGYIDTTAAILSRALELKAPGIKKGDPFHAAHAEAAGVTFLLTADEKFERAAAKMNLSVKIITPINFLPEVERWKQSLT